MTDPLPQQELLDNLYELQSARERGGVNSDLAVFGDETAANCTYLVDYATCSKEVDERGVTQKLVYDGTRLVLTGLPPDQEDFSGARLAITDDQEGVELPDGSISTHTVFIIGSTLTVQCFSLDDWNANDFRAEMMDFEPKKLTDMISIPKGIYPFPATIEDERHIPKDLESIIDPQNQTYTLGAGFFDREIVENRRMIADRVGINNFGDEEDPHYVYYRVRISEDFENLDLRQNEFDRQINAAIDFSEIIPLEVLPMGEELPRTVMQSSIYIKATRESIFLYCHGEADNIVLYKVTENTRDVIDEILAQSGSNSASS